MKKTDGPIQKWKKTQQATSQKTNKYIKKGLTSLIITEFK